MKKCAAIREISKACDLAFFLNGNNPDAAYGYKVQGDALYVNERYYTPNRHVSDAGLAGYMESGVRLYGNLFLGMTTKPFPMTGNWEIYGSELLTGMTEDTRLYTIWVNETGCKQLFFPNQLP